MYSLVIATILPGVKSSSLVTSVTLLPPTPPLALMWSKYTLMPAWRPLALAVVAGLVIAAAWPTRSSCPRASSKDERHRRRAAASGTPRRRRYTDMLVFSPKKGLNIICTERTRRNFVSFCPRHGGCHEPCVIFGAACGASPGVSARRLGDHLQMDRRARHHGLLEPAAGG